MSPNQNDNVDKWQELIEKFFSLFTRILGIVLNFLGVPGLIVVCLTYLIVDFSSSEQKSKIIDKYVLFESSSNCQNGLILLILIFLIVVFITAKHYKNKIQLINNELERCSSEKTKLQNAKHNFKSTKK